MARRADDGSSAPIRLLDQDDQTAAAVRRFPLWLLPVVAAVLLGVVLATIERGPPDDAAVADGLSENLLDVPVVARPPLEFLERFDLAADAPLVATPDPNQEIESLLKPRLSVWGPVAPHESVWAYSWVVDHSSGAPAVIVADPTVLQRVAAYEAVADVDGSPVRMLVAGDSRTLEWDAGGYGMTVIGYGIEPEPLLLLAAIVHIDQKTGAPTLLGVPEGFEVTAATVASSSTAGPGQQGWKARYVIRGGDGTSFELVASSGRAIPVEELHAQVGLEHMVEVRGQSALAFDYSPVEAESLYTPRARLLWVAGGVVFEASSAALPLTELVETVEMLDWPLN